MGRSTVAKNVSLYRGPGCHLCDEAKALLTPLLQGGTLSLDVIDIGTSHELQRELQFRIPVLRLPSGRDLDWPFSGRDVERALAEEP